MTQIKISLPLLKNKQQNNHNKKTQQAKQAYKWRREYLKQQKWSNKNYCDSHTHKEYKLYNVLLFTHFILILENCML